MVSEDFTDQTGLRQEVRDKVSHHLISEVLLIWPYSSGHSTLEHCGRGPQVTGPGRGVGAIPEAPTKGNVPVCPAACLFLKLIG